MASLATHLVNAFLLTVVLVIALERVALPAGLIDLPDARKRHGRAVPVVGGLAMFAAFVGAAMLSGWLSSVPWGFLVGQVVLVGIGVIDDIRGIRPLVRLAGQIAAAALMIVPGPHVISVLAVLPGGVVAELGPLGVPFTVLFVVGMINAFNMLDGLDGLAGGAAAGCFFWLALVAGLATRDEMVILLSLLFATFGFLVFNLRHPWRRQASVFMGDAGSTMLGASVSFFIVSLAASPSRAASLPMLLWACALPTMDTLSLIARRLIAKQSPFRGDRRHLHYLLIDAGVPPAWATALIVALCFVLGGIGVAGHWLDVPDIVMVVGLLFLMAGHTWFVASQELGSLIVTDIASPGQGSLP